MTVKKAIEIIKAIEEETRKQIISIEIDNRGISKIEFSAR